MNTREQVIEKAARIIAASRMRLIADPNGERLPDDLWQQARPEAERLYREEMLTVITAPLFRQGG